MKIPLIQVIATQLLLLQVGQTTALPQEDKDEASLASLEKLGTVATMDALDAPKTPTSPATVTIGTASTVVVEPPTTVTVATPSTTITITSSSTPSTLKTVSTTKKGRPFPNPGKPPMALGLPDELTRVSVPTWDCYYQPNLISNHFYLMGRNWNVSLDEVRGAARKSDWLTAFEWWEYRDVVGNAQVFYADFKLPIKTAKRLEKNLDKEFIIPFAQRFDDLRHMKCSSNRIYYENGSTGRPGRTVTALGEYP